MLKRQLILAAKRDELKATRPFGCLCLGRGGFGVELAAGHDQWYFEETCCCPEGLEAARMRTIILTSQEDRYRLADLGRRWVNSDIPEKFSSYRLSTWPSAFDYPSVMERLMESANGSWFLTGPVGRGKTGLAVGLAWSTLEGGRVKSVRFVTLPAFIAMIQASYNNKEVNTQAIVDRYANTGLLIMDDIGAEHVKDKEWEQGLLFQVIGERHAQERPTIITSNLSLQELEQRIGERIAHRIFEMVGDNIINMRDMPNLRAREG